MRGRREIVGGVASEKTAGVADRRVDQPSFQGDVFGAPKQVEVAERDRNHDLKEQLVPPGDPFFGTEEDA